LTGVRATLVAVENQLSIAYYECSFAVFGIQQAMRISQLSSVACPALQYPSTLTQKRLDKKKVIEHKMCVLIFLTFVSNISHSKKN
jgi:hypothetical protein